MRILNLQKTSKEKIQAVINKLRELEPFLSPDFSEETASLIREILSSLQNEVADISLIRQLSSAGGIALADLVKNRASASEIKALAEAVFELEEDAKKNSKVAEYDFFKTCGSCGKCCRRSSPFIFSFEKDFIEKHLPQLKEVEGYFEGKRKKEACIFYNKKEERCVIYEERPLDCRLFPYSFALHHVLLDDESVFSAEQVFLFKASACPVANRLGFEDLFGAIKLVSFILARASKEELLAYSKISDPNKMEIKLSIPYREFGSISSPLKKASEIYSKQAGGLI